MLIRTIFCHAIDKENPALTARPAVTSFFRRSLAAKPFCHRTRARVILAVILTLLCLAPARQGRGEAMLELFRQTWPQITAKIPELAEAGYDAIYVPNPCKGNSGGFSPGYDVFDPF